jgi:hypothetical protein
MINYNGSYTGYFLLLGRKVTGTLQTTMSGSDTKMLPSTSSSARDGTPSEVIPSLLGSKEGLKKLTSWLSKTRFYEDICPRYRLSTS